MDDLGLNCVVGLVWVCVERWLYGDLLVGDFFEIAQLIDQDNQIFVRSCRTHHIFCATILPLFYSE